MKSLSHITSSLILLCLIFLSVLNIQAQRVIFVNDDANGLNNGTTWENAYTDLQAGLLDAQTGDEIWVAKGMYKPTTRSDRNISFQLKNGVAMYGGFEGGETALADRDLTKIENLRAFVSSTDFENVSKQVLVTNFSATILSGDIGVQNNRTDNSYQVLYGQDIDSTCTLNGFLVMEGTSYSNSPNRFGAGMYMVNSFPQINSCSFIGNQVGNGGGGMYNNNSSPRLVDCYFSANTAYRGGGIFNENNSAPKLFNCYFNKNTASFGGGAYCTGSTLELINCEFNDNFAYDSGGGMYTVTGQVTLTNVFFGANIAIHGAGMYNIVNRPVLTNCQFSSNYSDFDGGGMYNAGSSPILINCHFTDNSSKYDGAGMYNDGSGTSPELIDCYFERNITNEFGGGMHNKGGATPILTRCYFIENEAKFDGGAIFNRVGEPRLDNCFFIKNRASWDGGGISNYDSSNPILNNCFFEQNRAGTNGGAIANKNESSPEYINCTFTQNEASRGGGMYNRNATPTLSNCHFILDAASFGGGMYNLASRTQLDSCYFSSNSATSSGGGIYNKESALILSACSVNDNEASFNGGGLFFEGGKPIIIKSLLSQNTAQNGGGIYIDYLEEGLLDIRSSTISGNKARVNGGGMFNNYSVNLISSTLYQNTSDGSGPSIYLTSEGHLTTTQNIIVSNSIKQDFYLEMGGEIISGGNNLVGNEEGNTSWQLTDSVGNATSPIDPILAPLEDNGGPTATHALMKNSPAINAGGLLYLLPVDILFDQRGFSRINSPQDSLSDIGAYERHRTEIKQARNFTICDTDSSQTIDDIMITDPAGGAFAIADSQTLVFELPTGFEYDATNAAVYGEGEGLIIKSFSFDLANHQIQITYDRTYTNSACRFIISGLQAKFSGEEPIAGKIVRTGGTARQIDHEVSDAVVHAVLAGFPTVNISQGYIDSFEESNGNWLALGENNLWEWAMPNGTVIQETEANKAWITDADSAYTADKSYIVESGCFNYSALQNPVINLDIWSDTEAGFDGTVLQFSDDRGQTWETIGSVGTGEEWYDSENILGSPGNQFKGWSGRDTTWRLASHLLAARLSSAPSVRFRIAFGSSILADPSQTNNGFAFDNFSIGEAEAIKKILFEQYTNFQNVNSSEQFIADNPKSLIPIRYFLSKGEVFYDKNPAGPRVRSLYYGISEPGITVVNGRDYLGPTSNIEQSFLDKSKSNLGIPSFFIEINPTNPDASVEITSLRDFESEELIVFMTLIENGVVNGNSAYDYVFRKFLPDAGGINYQAWSASQTETYSLSWFENQTSILDHVDHTDSLYLVVFVQNQQTKEIYQVASTKVWPELMVALEKRDGKSFLESSLAVYPNPASEYLTLQMGDFSQTPSSISFYNLQGAVVKRFHLAGGQNEYQIDVKNIPSGWYYIRVGTDNEIWLQDRILVIR